MDTLERLITELRRDQGQRDPSPEGDHFTDASRNPEEDPWSRLAQLEARLRSSDSPYNEQSIAIESESEYSKGSLSTPTVSLEIHVDWALLNRELLQRGLPPVLTFDSEYGLPTPEAAHNALQSALHELTRIHPQAESLKVAAEMASQREVTALKKLEMEAQNVPKAEKEWQNRAVKAQEDAARAKESEAASRHATKEAAVEVADLKTSLDRLQRQLFAKSSENEALKLQLQDHLDKQTQIHLTAKESVKRIRQVFAAERVNAGGGGSFGGLSAREVSKQALIVKTPSISTPLSALNALQVAKVYESQLRAAEEETLAARAETSLLREKLEAARSLEKHHSSNLNSIDIYHTNENSVAAKKVAKAEALAARAREEAEVLREEIGKRVAMEEYERLQRQNEILTRRLGRLEKERDSSSRNSANRSIPANSRGGRPTGQSTPFFSTISPSRPQQQQQISRQLTLEIIESTSSILNCTEMLELPKIARQLQRSLTSVPALQQFVDNVCQTVFRQGSAFVPWSLRQEEPSDVPAILLKWIEMLEDAEETQGRLKQLQIQQKHELQNPTNSNDNPSKQSKPSTTAEGKQKNRPKVITVSRVASGKGFPEIEIFAPASRF